MQSVFAEIEKNFVHGQPGEAKRLFHGRGQCFFGFEHLCIDYYPPAVHCIWYEEPEKRTVDDLVEGLKQTLGQTLECLVFQYRSDKKREPEIVFGKLPRQHQALEDGLLYHIDLGQRQNIGFFLDMRQGRHLVRSRAEGKRVLNLFAYTCSFSVTALTGGASAVLNMDMNRSVLALGQRNHQLNSLDPRQAVFLDHDIFRSFGKLTRLGPYDLVIIDPPTFQRGSFQIKRDYPKLLRRLKGLLATDAEIIATMNSPVLERDFLDKLFSELLPEAKLLGAYGPPTEGFAECGQQERGVKILHYGVKKN